MVGDVKSRNLLVNQRENLLRIDLFNMDGS